MAKKIIFLFMSLFLIGFASATPTTADAILYSTMMLFLVFMFGLILFLYFNIPDHKRDEDGLILDVSKLGYLKPLLLGLAWIMLTSIVFIAANISVSELSTGLLGEGLFLIWRLMFISNFVLLPLSVIYMIQKAFFNKEMRGLIERGVEFK